MKILFVYGNMYSWGGIQTLLTRLAPELRARGHEVGLLTRPRGLSWDDTSEIVDRLSRDATIQLADGDWFRAPRSVGTLAEADVLFACSLESLLLAALVQEHLLPSARIVAGVFSPREYCWKTSRLKRRWSQHLSERLVGRLPAQNFAFSMESMARQTGECLGRDLSAAPLLPIPIDTERFRPTPDRRVDPSKIVSVTRLAPYYTHHAAMIRVIRDLRDAGHDFEYHAYGDGPTRGALEADVRRLGVEGAVFFHGTVEYERLADVLGDAFLYVGMGTALLEAAACGVPALVGIDSHPGAATYGFVHETVGTDLGSHVPDHPEYPIEERILWLAGRSNDEYRQVERATRARAEEFGADRVIPRFVDIVGGALPFSFSISAADRALGRLDALLEATVVKLGGPDVMGTRHERRVPRQEIEQWAVETTSAR